MLKSAPNAKKKTNPLVWVVVAAVAIGAYVMTSGGDDGPVATTKKPVKKGSSMKADAVLTEADTNAKFNPVAIAAVDVFNPLIKKAAVITDKIGATKPTEIAHELTGGEPNWYYTGVAELDGVRQGLLENTVSGETAYVGVGDAWKAAHVVSIDVGVMVMSGPAGGEFRVPITAYGDMPGVTAPTAQIAANVPGGVQPLNVPGAAINGAIGGGLGVRPMGGAQATVPPDGQLAQTPPVLPDGTNATNRRNRQGRRNRNQNQGNQEVNNVP